MCGAIPYVNSRHRAQQDIEHKITPDADSDILHCMQTQSLHTKRMYLCHLRPCSSCYETRRTISDTLNSHLFGFCPMHNTQHRSSNFRTAMSACQIYQLLLCLASRFRRVHRCRGHKKKQWQSKMLRGLLRNKMLKTSQRLEPSPVPKINVAVQPGLARRLS